jgi:hypothetical protein
MLPGTGTVVWFEYNQSFQTVKYEETSLQKVFHITRIKRVEEPLFKMNKE